MELDHVFVCAEPEALIADRLAAWGFQEGPRNAHPGQGTANRRFFFRNAYLEFLWVDDPQIAQSPQTAPTRLWERWARRLEGTCPFGIILRLDSTEDLPFPAWRYEPEYLPEGFEMFIAETTLEEPMVVAYRRFSISNEATVRSAPQPQNAIDVTRIRIECPNECRSSVFRLLPEVVVTVESPAYSMAIELDHGRRGDMMDLGQGLPLTLRR